MVVRVARSGGRATTMRRSERGPRPTPPSAPARWDGGPPNSTPTGLRSRLGLLGAGRDSGHAKPKDVEPVLRSEPGPVRRPGAAGRDVPTPAADHPGQGMERTIGIVDTRLTVIIGFVP